MTKSKIETIVSPKTDAEAMRSPGVGNNAQASMDSIVKNALRLQSSAIEHISNVRQEIIDGARPTKGRFRL